MTTRAFTYTAPPGTVVFGAGAARTRLAEQVDALEASRVLVVAAEAEGALADELAAPLGGRVAGRFAQVRQHVPVEVAEAARAAAAEAGADLLLSIGGGSTTGTAKAVALTTGLPILAVPTTYAGSEMTPVWGLTEGGRKTTGTDPRVQPRVVVYDPELTVTLPGPLSVASGLNAMAHSVEAFWAAGANPVTDALAADSIAALARSLPGVLADGADVHARFELLYGAWLAGSAFAVAGSGLHHKVCHALGGAFDLPHAETHAVVLPHVLAFNEGAVPAAARRITAALSQGTGGGAGEGVEAGAAARLAALDRAVGAPRALRDLGLAEADLPRAIETVAGAVVPALARTPGSNPRPVREGDVEAIVRAAWTGDTP